MRVKSVQRFMLSVRLKYWRIACTESETLKGKYGWFLMVYNPTSLSCWSRGPMPYTSAIKALYNVRMERARDLTRKWRERRKAELDASLDR